MERLRTCEVPRLARPFSSIVTALLMASRSTRIVSFTNIIAAGLLRSAGLGFGNRSNVCSIRDRKFNRPPLVRRVYNDMDTLSGYAHHPLQFVLRYLRQRPASHIIILSSVVLA